MSDTGKCPRCGYYPCGCATVQKDSSSPHCPACYKTYKENETLKEEIEEIRSFSEQQDVEKCVWIERTGKAEVERNSALILVSVASVTNKLLREAIEIGTIGHLYKCDCELCDALKVNNRR